jgi:hypothetical protein
LQGKRIINPSSPIRWRSEKIRPVFTVISPESNTADLINITYTHKFLHIVPDLPWQIDFLYLTGSSCHVNPDNT